MKYVQNNGRYDLAFTYENKGKEIKIIFYRRRLYLDTGNIAVSGITEVEDKAFEKLSKNKRFAALLKSGEFELTDVSKLDTAETKVTALEKENAELKAKLSKQTENKNEKELEEKDKEIASLKAQLEAMATQNKANTEATADQNKANIEDF